MAIFTSAEIEAQITAWKAALTALSTGQEYMIGDRRLRRADLPEIIKTIEWLEGERGKLTLTDGCRRSHAVAVGDSW